MSNRFRYYNPESSNYLSSDQVGSLGGETPYGYVFNPLDWVDLFGLAGYIKNTLDGLAREKRAKEARIQEFGGIFVRNPTTKEMIQIDGISTVISAK
ncbi:hypothetical protein EDL98_10250 [Ornithobacterium rhinotracheale]|uniref:RHS repeat-associated core domain-containing protein n=1 Tax=Ornithobacterium rhinotracheale TaxID=28251 RepID=UPI001627D77D|nr:hypothetical protein [Ornithobacterium rhinotracheale]